MKSKSHPWMTDVINYKTWKCCWYIWKRVCTHPLPSSQVIGNIALKTHKIHTGAHGECIILFHGVHRCRSKVLIAQRDGEELFWTLGRPSRWYTTNHPSDAGMSQCGDCAPWAWMQRGGRNKKIPKVVGFSRSSLTTATLLLFWAAGSPMHCFLLCSVCRLVVYLLCLVFVHVLLLLLLPQVAPHGPDHLADLPQLLLRIALLHRVPHLNTQRASLRQAWTAEAFAPCLPCGIYHQ